MFGVADSKELDLLHWPTTRVSPSDILGTSLDDDATLSSHRDQWASTYTHDPGSVVPCNPNLDLKCGAGEVYHLERLAVSSSTNLHLQ